MTLFEADCNYSLSGAIGTQFRCNGFLSLFRDNFSSRQENLFPMSELTPRLFSFLNEFPKFGQINDPTFDIGDDNRFSASSIKSLCFFSFIQLIDFLLYLFCFLFGGLFYFLNFLLGSLMRFSRQRVYHPPLVLLLEPQAFL